MPRIHSGARLMMDDKIRAFPIMFASEEVFGKIPDSHPVKDEEVTSKSKT